MLSGAIPSTWALAFSFFFNVRFVQVGLLKFSNTVDVSFDLSTYDNVDDIVEAIERLDIEGGDTNIALALRTARNQMFLSRNDTRFGAVTRLLILITDGTATDEIDATIPEANLTKEAGIRIFTVGIGYDTDEQQLKDIATAPWEAHYFPVSDFGALQSVVQEVINRSCEESAPLPTITTATPNNSVTPASRGKRPYSGIFIYFLFKNLALTYKKLNIITQQHAKTI